jgi:dolichol-phosphate mannosyltransferase
MNISVVIPCYNESKNLTDLQTRFSALPLFKTGEIELILVNDGSTDNTGQKITEWANKDSRVVAVNLLANCGNQRAILNGIWAASGDSIVIMDADLQDPPEDIEKMKQEMIDNKVVAVIGVKLNRYDNNRLVSLLKTVATIIFPLKQGEGDFCLLKKELAKELLDIGNPTMPFRVRRWWAARRKKSFYFPYKRSQRLAGSTKFNYKKLAKLWWLNFKGFYFSASRQEQAFKHNIKYNIKK